VPSRLGTGIQRGSTRAARAAVAVLFFTNGALFANLIPRFPEIKDDLGLSNAALGSALAAFPLGAVILGLLAAVVVARYRSARVAVGGVLLLASAVVLTGAAPTWAALAGAMFVAGGIDAILDVAQNTHGLRVQRLYGRSVVNSFHGVWSIGSVAGGLMGSAAAGLSIPLVTHLFAAAALCGAVALTSYRFLLRGPDDDERLAQAELIATAEGRASSPGPGRSRLRTMDKAVLRIVLPLGIVAACGAFVEDAGASWGAIYLRDELGAAAATAGLAFVALQAAMTVGRLFGDRVVDRYGQRTVARVGGALIAVGMGLALALPSIPSTLAGFALSGIGVATLVPAAMHAADELPGLPSGAGLTVVSWLLRVGFLISPPLVGIVADAVSLRVGLFTVVLAGLVVLPFAGVLVDRASR
jgi:MFS family permease